MLTENTLSKLHEMRLGVMAAQYRKQLTDTSVTAMPFEDRFGLLVDVEWSTRKSNRLKRLIKQADYAIPSACIEDIAYHADRKLDKTFVSRLASGVYIQENHNVIILGATGVGKTYLACALGMAASRSFYPVKYARLPDLLGELALARADGSYRKVIKQYKQVRLLILDEWLLYTPKENEARDILEIVEARQNQGATVLCSQFDVSDWHAKIGDQTLADAICDRIVHNAYTVTIFGESMRKRNGIAE
jgi:DNA replication protein DnaC